MSWLSLYAIILPLLVHAQPEGQTAAPFPCGHDVCGRWGYVACIDDPSLVDKPQCKDCWRMRQACGTVTEHVGCNLYCGDQIRQQEGQKFQREIERINSTTAGQLQEKESEIQNITDQIREANKKIAQLQANLNRVKTTEQITHRALGTPNKTTGEVPVTSDTRAALCSPLTVAVICVIMGAIIMVLLGVVYYLYTSRYYGSKRTPLVNQDEETGLLHDVSARKDSEIVDKSNNTTQDSKVSNDITPTHGQISEYVPPPAHGTIIADELISTRETTYANGATPTHGTTPANGSTSTHGTTSANGSISTRETTYANGATPTHGTTPANGSSSTHGITSANGSTSTHGTTSANRSTSTHGLTSENEPTTAHGTSYVNGLTHNQDTRPQSYGEKCKAMSKLNQCPPTQPDQDGRHELITNIQC